jgi:UDP-glucose 4-epimerase
MHVLVAGGAGFIGSVTVEELLDAGHHVTVFDDLSAGHRRAVDERADLVVGSTSDAAALDAVLSHDVDAVVNFSAFIAVGESMSEPGKYFANNVANTITLLNAMLRNDVRRFVFSSTAAVFGEPRYVPIDEAHPLDPVNPYGQSKLIVEQMLRWYDERAGLRSVALRYFNAAGASASYGEDHDPETHLIPILLDVAEGKRPSLPLFGDDYPTPDGTCVRDYVHVQDLAQAHILALGYAGERSGRFNLGIGSGRSNLEVAAAVERVTGRRVPIDVLPRRAGDPPELVAASALARSELGWQPRFEELDGVVASAWRWRQTHAKGYGA